MSKRGRGYDRNDPANDSIDDTEDDIVVDESFDDGALSFTYDANGNLTNDGTFQYIYDAWNRLVKVVGSADSGAVTIAEYAYDGTGRRIKKVVTNRGDLDGTEYYYYAGQQQIEVRDGSDNVLRTYIWGTQYVDEILMEIRESYSYYYHQDANYNVVAVTDFDGYMVSRMDYSTYGKPRFYDANGWPVSRPADDGPTGNALHATVPAWQGLFWDAETELTYNRARTLNHKLGKFMQRDPIGMFSAKIFYPISQYQDGMNLYSYANSSPLLERDPTGMTSGQGCKANQKQKASKALGDACSKIKDAWDAIAKGKSNPPDCIKDAVNCMNKKCQGGAGFGGPVHLHCDNCPIGPCGDTPISGGGHAISCFFGIGNHVTICGKWLNQGSADDVASTVAHEISHCCGSKDPWNGGISPCSADDIEIYIRQF